MVSPSSSAVRLFARPRCDTNKAQRRLEIDMAFAVLTREQMLERCDLAGVAQVVSVGRQSPDSPNLAKLSFVRIVKGVLRERDGFVHVRLRGSAPRSLGGVPGPWSDWWDYPVDATVMTHLDWNGAEAVYQTTWPGAVLEIEGAVSAVA
jgi:hypothetical protein